ncbi:hypothetical protein QYM36_000081 [Artemia franciscana]|uniref:NHR domain-containing protein n=1 Tax=Artemia franciscana TaxID=6661 RepID=A0AA88IPM1_ARTSF|nr:hypothetical protein QYM36_000081 [Artemia franciscana]
MLDISLKSGADVLGYLNTVAVRGEYSRNAFVRAPYQLNREENFEIQVESRHPGVVAPNQYNTIYPFVEQDGTVDRVRIVSNGSPAYHPSSPGGESLLMSSLSANLSASLVQDVSIEAGPSKSIEEGIKFSEIHGRNICLVNNGLSAKRTASYNQDIVLSRMPIAKGQKFEVRIEKLTN